MTFASVRTLRAFVLICLFGTVLADWLFYSQPAGFNLVFFHAFVLMLAIVQTPSALRRYLLLIVLLTALLIAMAAQPGPLVIALFWFGLVSLVFAARQGWSTNALDWLSRWTYFAFLCWLGPLRDLWSLARCRRAGHGRQLFAGSGRAIANWTLPVLGSFIFIALFYSANPVLSFWFQQATRSIEALLNTFVIAPPRFLFWFLTGLVLWALCRARSRSKRHTTELASGGILTSSSLTRCLTLFNAIFLVQTFMDIFYLWGGSALPSGLTYAGYAHRGAYPLIATALLAGGFVLLAFRAGLPTRETNAVRKLVYLFLAQNVFLTFNSILRLHLYVEVYSLTRLRIAAAIWMLLVSVGFLLLLFRIRMGRSNGWLLNANFVGLLAVLYVCAFVNFDSIISRYNVEHSREITGRGTPLDIDYLERVIGVEAIPALIWYSRNSWKGDAATSACLAANRLVCKLNSDVGAWRAQTLRKKALKKEIARATQNSEPDRNISIGLAALSVL